MSLSYNNTSNFSSQINKESCYFVHVIIFDDGNKGLFFTTIATIAVNTIFAIIAIMGNIVFLQTLWRTSSLHTPSNILLGNLAISDLLVGLVVQPLYVVYKSMEISGRHSCFVQISFSTMAWITVAVSFLNLITVSLERYVVIFKPFLHVSIVQVKTVGKVCVFIWSITVTLVLSRFLGLTSIYFYTICLSVVLLSFVTTITVYVKIYRIAKYHHRTIRDQSAATSNTNKGENGDNFVREAKLIKTVSLITGLFFLCYLPTLGIMAYYSLKGYSILTKTMYSWTDTIVFLNSSLNPIVYYLRNSPIREALIKLVWAKVEVTSKPPQNIAIDVRDS